MSWLLVSTGGILGSLLRFHLGRMVLKRWMLTFPYPTLFINITGAFILGLCTRALVGWFPHAHTHLMLLFGTGFCGAYTTFSTFAYETVTLFEEHRIRAALLYVLGSGVLGLLAAGLGLFWV
jgi:fluoride exporter